MPETHKDTKRGKGAYESMTLERTAAYILRHMEDKDSEDSLESTKARVLANARTIYGPTRSLDIVTFAPTSARKISAAIVEHNPTGRAYIHCSSAKEDTRIAAMEHLLVITEDILQRLVDAEGISSSGWLPNTAAAQQAAISHMFPGSNAGSVAGSVPVSRKSSVQPLETPGHSPQHTPQQTPQQHTPQTVPQHPNKHGHRPVLVRTYSDMIYESPPQEGGPPPRTSSEILHAPKPVPLGRLPAAPLDKVKWSLGSDV